MRFPTTALVVGKKPLVSIAFAVGFPVRPRNCHPSVRISRQSPRWHPKVPVTCSHPEHSVLPSFANAPLPASVGVGRDIRTGATVLLVGCVHGSQKSAQDVADVIKAAGGHPDALVLELCPQRLTWLMKSMLEEDSEASRTRSAANSGAALASKRMTSRWPSLRKLMVKFGGVGPALVAYALSAVYNIQRLTGTDPGVEFKTALRCIRVEDSVESCLVVCGDAPASDTIRSLFGAFLPQRALLSLPGALWSTAETLAASTKGGVNIPFVLLEGAGARLRELGRVFIPISGIFYLIGLVGASGAAQLHDGLAVTGAATGSLAWSDMLGSLLALLGTSIQVYIFIASFAFIQVLISERDAVLAKSIRKAASDLANFGNPSTGRASVIVAVVGLMHVNGVLRNLKTSSREGENP
jgi:hypothetical protein